MKISHNEIHVLTDNIVRLPHWQKKGSDKLPEPKKTSEKY